MSFGGYRPILLASLLLALGLSSQSGSRPQQQAPDPNVVKVVFSPIDKNGKLISALAKGDIRVFDDGTLQTITSFERLTDQRVSVAVLIDNSLSQQRLAQTATLTARGFVQSLMRSGTDQAMVVGFSGKATVGQELTTDKDTVLQAIDRLHFPTPASISVGAILVKGPNPEVEENTATAIWDAVWSASESLTVSSTWDSRRAILLLSDGEDTFSQRSMVEAIERAQRNDVAVYAIGMGDKNFNKVRQGILKRLAEETGGRAFFPKQIVELETIFAQLSEELRSPYLLRYTRTNRKPSGEIQKLKIQISGQTLGAVSLDYRRGYVSP